MFCGKRVVPEREIESLNFLKFIEDDIIKGEVPDIHDVQVAIEKSSFTRVGKIMLHFDPEFNLFTDKTRASANKKLDYEAPQEEMF